MADCPKDALSVRDEIAAAMKPHVNHGSAMDTGGGFGSADLWLQIGDCEYYVTVKPSRKLPPLKRAPSP